MFSTEWSTDDETGQPSAGYTEHRDVRQDKESSLTSEWADEPRRVTRRGSGTGGRPKGQLRDGKAAECGHTMRAREIAFVLFDRLRGARMRHHLRELEEAQTLGAEQLALWQQDKLFALLCHARDTTDFYRKRIPKAFSPSSTPAVLSSLPVISRQLMRAESERFVSNAFPPRKRALHHTSGSTGIPLAFWQDRDRSLRQKAEVVYFGGWAGYRVGDRYLYVGPERPRLRGWLRNELSLWSTHPDDSWFESLERTLRTRRVEILIAHPSVLIPFSLYLSRESTRPTKPPILRGVISISEPLTQAARLRIEQALGCPVLCRYSTRETGIIASECEEKRYHINVGSCHVEYFHLNEDRPNPDGGPSRAIVTALGSYAMPFIRYDIGDIVTPDPDRCVCGRSSPLLRGIEGRVLDAITTPEGRRVEGFDLCTQFEDLGAVAQFQFSQLRDGSYRVSVVPGIGYGDRTKMEITERCKRILGRGAVVRVQEVERIEPLPSGKTPLIHRQT